MPSTGKKTKGKNFRESEISRMLDIVEDKLPFGAEQWGNVAAAYNSHLPNGWPERDGESLKRKFLGLKNKRKPTGDPDCPSSVKRAKRAFQMIEGRCAITDLHDDVSDAPDESVARQNADAVGSSSELDSESGDFRAFMATIDDDTVVSSPAADPPTLPPLAAVIQTPPSGRSPGATVSQQSLQQAAQQSSARGQISSPLAATSRSGLNPIELARLSRSLDAGSRSSSRAPSTYLSQTAQRRIRLDNVLDRLASDATTPSPNSESEFLNALLLMEERQAARESDLRRDREEREAAREEREAARELAEQQFRLDLAKQQNQRDVQNQQLVMLIMSKIFGPQPSTNEQ